MSKAVCVGSEDFHSCLVLDGYGSAKRTSCVESDAVMIPARRVVGQLPYPNDSSDKVIMLYAPPPKATRIVLKEGGWELPLPTRSSLLNPGFVAMFTLMTYPGNRILRPDILEFELLNPARVDEAIKVFAELYDNFESVYLETVPKKPVETENYKVYWVEEKNRVVFEPLI